jgi:alpha-L-rhamnosidase
VIPYGVAHDSLNHYAKGAVVSFLHRYVAGVQPVEPAYRHCRVHPHPGGGLTWAEAVHESPYGRIAVRWDTAESFVLTVTVPPGCTAEAVLPDGTTHHLETGRRTLES